MTILVILGHPQPGSFNHAIADAICTTLAHNGYQVIRHDLYAEQFDPVLSSTEIGRDAPLPAHIAQHCADLVAADGIIMIHPNWWGQPPAILKGWVDRVIRPGVAYRFCEGDAGDGIPEGLLKAHTAIIFNTSNTPRERELQAFGDPLELLWKNCIFELCGVQQIYRRMFEVIITSSPMQREQWLTEVRDTIERFFPALGPT